IDHQTIEDNTVTVRYRDSMKQERVAVKNLKTLIEDHVSMKNWLKNC
ncbi:MAG: His/Gly/Thr/Pro-type tRNA ligase C-terminal domain-containing protein, partial [Flavobacteriaceae bacterium]|nr:His/Gly/Thr/Pro-type tRNA ligase C-terminal domain-containing protein [Flavobacteriaceae bacterium]